MRLQVFNYRTRALVRKELGQIRRDRRLALSLVVPPVLQMLLFGFALSATVTNIRLGIVDESRTPESRELIATLTESKSFKAAGYYLSDAELGQAISRGDLDAGMVVPADFSRDLHRGWPITIQFLLNAMNANTATISQGYAEAVIQNYNLGLQREGLHVSFRQQTSMSNLSHRGQTVLHPAFFYNPGL